MKEMLSLCGYRCDLCPAYEKNIGSMNRKKLSEGYLKYFHSKIAPKEIQPCRGCLLDGDEKCLVKPCVIERNLENCAHCPDFICEKLKPKMNAIEDNIKDTSCLSEEDYNLFVKPYKSKEYLSEVREK